MKVTNMKNRGFFSLALVTSAIVAVVLVGQDSGQAQQAGKAAAAPAAPAPEPGATTFRLLTFQVGNSGPRLGATRGNGIEDVMDVHNAIRYLYANNLPEVKGIPAIPIDMRSLIESGPVPIAAVKSLYATMTAIKATGKFADPGGAVRVFHPGSGIEFLPPVTNPSKVFGLAGAYIRRNPDGTPGAYDNVEYPSAFLKPLTSVTSHNAKINLDGLVTTGVHEPEMAVIIGKKATDVPVAEAMDYIMGYSILNDVSARDLKQGAHTSQGSTISKGLDTFSPFGPYITLKEDVPNPHGFPIVAKINGKPWEISNAHTQFLTFTIAETIAYFSERVTLMPGDVIATGVPNPVVPLKAGDTIEITIGTLGTLRNYVVSEPTPGHKLFPPRVVAPVPTR